VKHKESGLTVVELLTVVGIIVLLVGLLIPATSMVRRIARETKQKAQFVSIELALAAFRNDYGEYPPSNWWAPPPAPSGPRDYCGAQKLAEALVGWDLLGCHPDTHWQADGSNAESYWALGRMWDPGTYFFYNPDSAIDMDKRKGPYLELSTANVFRLGYSRPGVRDGLFSDTTGGWGGALSANTYVLCDVFPVPQAKLTLANGKVVAPGTPVLYYRADSSKRSIDISVELELENLIYNFRDNFPLVSLKRLADWKKPIGYRLQHSLEDIDAFYEFIRDPKVQAIAWPYRPDSYILISAGADGLYGTSDDICNFGN